MDLAEVPGASFRRHPWEVARARFFCRVVRSLGLLDAPHTVLDVGAGDGYVARTLQAQMHRGSSVVCFDAHYRDADLNRRAPTEGLSFVREQPAGRFDLLMLLDVIEHVPDDRAFLDGFVRESLAPGGWVIVSVPAWPSLFSRHDGALKHVRRYRPKECKALLATVGLTVCRSGGLFHSLLLPRLVTAGGERVLRRLGRPSRPPPHLGEWHRGETFSTIMEGILTADNAITHALSRTEWELPGLSFWAACTRTDEPFGEGRV